MKQVFQQPCSPEVSVDFSTLHAMYLFVFFCFFVYDEGKKIERYA